MSYPTDRVILFDRNMNPLPELAPSEVFSRVRSEEINGEHALTLVTTRRLEEGWRMLTVDGMGKWREWVVTEPDEEHNSGVNALGTYHCVWSLQYDLTYSYFHDTEAGVSIGLGSDTTASVAAQEVLRGVSGWTVGDCDAPAIADGTGCVFIRESAWSKLSKLVECSACEVDSVIEVSPLFGVTARRLCLKAHVGMTTASRRFDWGHDLTSIKRTPDPGPYYCRVVPLGKGDTEYADDDETTYDYPIDITEETGEEGELGPYWIQDDDAAAAFRISDGNGGWIYPTKVVSYSEDDPELLYNMAMDELHEHTRPGVTYEADVLQFTQAGMDVHGVALGDEVQCVDYGFNPDAALRIQGRVIKIEVDELSPETSTKLTIGQLQENFADSVNSKLANLSTKITATSQAVSDMNTSSYMKSLVDRLNAEINATGGYAYLVPGEGFVVYDTAVADPTNGYEASQVVQIKGGSIRIANTRKPIFNGLDDWNWKSVFRSGLVATDVLSATNIITGLIHDAKHALNPNYGNYWDLDNSTLVVRDGSILANLITAGKIQSNNGKVYFDLDNNEIAANRLVSTNNQNDKTVVELSAGKDYATAANIYSFVKIYRTDATGNGSYVLIKPPLSNSGSDSQAMIAVPNPNQSLSIAAGESNQSYHPVSEVKLYETSGGTGVVHIRASTKNGDYTLPDGEVYIDGHYIGIQTGSAYGDTVVIGSSNSTIRINGTISASGMKNRVVDTENFEKRILSCYETPTPMFGDIGSSCIESGGDVIVSVDPIFAETIQRSGNYKVFLQKCGAGDLWVSEKHPDYFVVKGTPGLPFDWEIKAVQDGYENVRLENWDTFVPDSMTASKIADITESVYNNYVEDLEQLYDEERAA